MVFQCVFEKFTLVRNIYHKIQNGNTLIYAGNDTLTISCAELNEPIVKEIRNTGEMTAIVGNSCQIFSK